MKKLNLKGLSEVLSDNELKNVVGGSVSDGCGAYLCNSDSNCPPAVTGYSHCGKCYYGNVIGAKGICGH